MLRAAGVALLCSGLVLAAGPARAAGDQPIGVVELSHNAHIDGLDAAVGSDFYGGEEFVTFEQGAMQLRVRQCRIDLGASTDARFLPDSHPDRLLVIQGSARYSCPAGAWLWIDTPAGIVHGAQGEAASGMINVTDAHNLVISAYGQGLILDNDGDLHTIAAGESYRVVVTEEAADVISPQDQKKHRRRKVAMWLVDGSAGTFAAVELWRYVCESPWKP